MFPQNAKMALDRWWDQTLPVNPVQLAGAMGAHLEVIADQDRDGLGGGDQEISSATLVDQENPVIWFNDRQARIRQRFAIAHGLGHLLLHHGISGGEDLFRDPPEHFLLNHPDLYERHANDFATKLLMPAEVIHWLIRELGITDIQELARKLEVSKAAMKYRLKALDLIT